MYSYFDISKQMFYIINKMLGKPYNIYFLEQKKVGMLFNSYFGICFDLFFGTVFVVCEAFIHARFAYSRF